jgi:glutathione S-transferase
MGKIIVTAMKWAPPFAAGKVRDHRARWVLNEVGWPYEIRLVDEPTKNSAEYRAKQPFGQVPLMEEEGRPPMFESGAIVLDVAMRAGKLTPETAGERAQMLQWSIAALNSIEPFLMNLAEVDYFMNDEAEKAKRRPGVLALVETRLGELQTALGDRTSIVSNSFTAADLILSSVLKIAHSLDVLDRFSTLASYHARCMDRPAQAKAVADQLAEIQDHDEQDMKYDQAERSTG